MNNTENNQEGQLDANLVIEELNSQLAEAQYQIAVLRASIKQMSQQKQVEED